jgi:hypothetical protein
MRNRQRGITAIGFVILAMFIGLFVYAGIRLLPVYMEYMNIAKALDKLKQDSTGLDSQTAIRNVLDKAFNIDYVSSLDARDILITREGNNWSVRAEYDAPAPFVGNVSFVVHFDKIVILGPPGGG